MSRKVICSLVLVALWGAMMPLFTACEKQILSEESAEEPSASQVPNSRLRIRTRAVSGEQVSYPVTVYIINNEGVCVQKMTLTTADDDLSVDLVSGTYQVYAVGGATTEAYILPDVDNVSAESEIALKDGAAHADLMTAKNTVKVGRNETNTLTLGMVRKVINLKSVVIKDIPESATAVSLTLAPLYKNLLLNGSYATGNNSQTATVSLTKQNDGTTWQSASEVFMMPFEDETTVTVTMTLGGQTYNYMYATSLTLEANHELSIAGTYTGDLGEFTLSGSFTGAVWGEPVTISFTFNEEGAQADNGNGGNNNSTEDEEAPATGTWYKNCYVFMSTDDGDYTVVTLLHRNEIDVEVANKTQDDFKTEINTSLPGFDINSITNWRLPTEDEAKAIRANTVNQSVLSEGGKEMAPSGLYFYDKGNDELGTFFGRGDLSAYFTTPSVTIIHLRPVTTLRFKKPE